MPELKHSFQKGRMNKDLDERLVPNGEYRDALNVEVSTSEEDDVGALQTTMGNINLDSSIPTGYCVGSIVNEKNDKLYWLVAGDGVDFIAEYDYETRTIEPVCVDWYGPLQERALNFDPNFPVTGINIIDDLLFWTDNNSEPKKINITRGKLGSQSFTTHTMLMVKDPEEGSGPNNYISVTGIKEEHLTVKRIGPPTAPVLEMKDTPVGDYNRDGTPGQIVTEVLGQNPFLSPPTGNYFDTPVDITTNSPVDWIVGDYIILTSQSDATLKIRAIINGYNWSGSIPVGTAFKVTVMSGDVDITLQEQNFHAELEQPDPLFQFKFPRFAYRYKYEDGEYSAFSPFTEVAFLPGKFDYMPKEGYNLGMVNRLRNLVIKDFVHERLLPDDVISIDLLYKESNSPNVYSVKTVKRIPPQTTTVNGANHVLWDCWNAVNSQQVRGNGTRGFLRITSEMIHAVLPANQLLRPWDNVPRKALAQEITKNRLVYGNYLQNYNLSNLVTREKHIDVRLDLWLTSNSLGNKTAEQRNPGINPNTDNSMAYDYMPGKSVKSLRTYQIGVVYIDKYGRETPVFSEDSRGSNPHNNIQQETSASLIIHKDNAVNQNKLKTRIKSTAPDWAKAYKFFIKETSNEYYNMAMDRWYNAEDGNIWISFPSAERNKIDEETFLILKKEHDNSNFVTEPARYKAIAIENEAPYFIKLRSLSMGSLEDDGSFIGVPGGTGFPLPERAEVYVSWPEFVGMTWNETLMNADISEIWFRLKTTSVFSKWYQLSGISKSTIGTDWAIFKASEPFGDDMSITSVDGTYTGRVSNLEIEVSKRIPEDKPEFDGRFFVKIKKDLAIIDRIIKPDENEQKYIVVSAMMSQYINPRSRWAKWAGNWDGYGTDRKLINLSETNADGEFFHYMGPDHGDGQPFWRWASNGNIQEPDHGYDSNSTGWFIDNVESFRRFKYAKHFWNYDNSYRLNPGMGGDAYHWYKAYYHPGKWMSVCGLNTYDDHYDNYLDIGYHIKSPINKQTKPGHGGFPAGTLNAITVKDKEREEGGQIFPSTGIDTVNDIIHLSYAGIGEDERCGTAPSGAVGTAYGVQLENVDRHVSDLYFATLITTPGTLWRWKEDPGQIVYQTIRPDFDTRFPYTQEQWNANQRDYFDEENGIALYNYSRFVDYCFADHHQCGNSKWRCKTWKSDFVSMRIGGKYHYTNCVDCWDEYSVRYHDSKATSDGFYGGGSNSRPRHYRIPSAISDWNKSWNKRRRFTIHAKTLKEDRITGERIGLGKTGPHYYLPTNDPDLPSHFDNVANAITTYPTGHTLAGNDLPEAPGIRSDGVYSGYELNGTEIPNLKRWDATVTTDANQSMAPGSVTWEILEPWDSDGKQFTSTNPAIFETEPKEDVGLDIYYEVGQIYPIELNDRTIEQFLGPISNDFITNPYIKCMDQSGTQIVLSTNTGHWSETDIRVSRVNGNKIQIHDSRGNPLRGLTNQTEPSVGDLLIFVRPDGSTTETTVRSIPGNGPNYSYWFELYPFVHGLPVTLPWFNCYSFGNGVESDRIRDDFNQVTIDNGPKASSTIETPYEEERRASGLIYSGIYNSQSGVNDLNQFIQAEKITKDINPVYGSIQKLHTRNTDLLTLCEDKIFKILANKDALYNADGNSNITATENVLGQTIPIRGEYGISKNPESFASESFRSYFTDKSRGAVLRLSQDGLTPISNVGMKDWFGDNLKNAYRIIGSIDDKKSAYNVTLIPKEDIPFTIRRQEQDTWSPTRTGVNLGDYIGGDSNINPYDNPPTDPEPPVLG